MTKTSLESSRTRVKARATHTPVRTAWGLEESSELFGTTEESSRAIDICTGAGECGMSGKKTEVT